MKNIDVVHKKQRASGNDGSGLMGLFFATWNLCMAGISKDNKSSYDDKEVTCPDCLKLLTSGGAHE